MSISLMSAVWRMDLPTTEKMVLLALADAANDDGVTWMALEAKEDIKLDLLKKTGLSRRAVQGAVKRLIDGGLLHRSDRPGKGVVWTVKGCTSCAPQEMRPAGDAPRGARGAPKPSTNHQSPSEAKASSGGTRKRDLPPPTKRCPESWSPSAADLLVASGEGFEAGALERALAKFRDITFRTARSDWSATFRNFLREQADRRPPNVHRPDHHTAQLDHLEAIARAMGDPDHGGPGDRDCGPSPDHGGGLRSLPPAA